MFRWLQGLLRLAPEDLPTARSLFAQHFVLVAALLLAKVARDGLFLSVLPARALPFVFLALAAWTAVTAFAVTKLVRDRPSHQVLAAMQAVAAVSLLLFAALFTVNPRVSSVAFYLWYGTYGVLAVAQFWILAGERVNPRQARRLFPAIGAAGIFGGLVGGGAAFVLGSYFPAPLFLVGAALLHFALVPAALRGGRRPEEAPPEREWNLKEASFKRALSFPYVRTVALLFLLAGVVSTLLEYQFKYLVQERITGERELTSFFGLFHWAQGLFALGLQLVATRWLLYHLGARWGRIALPGGILAGAATSLVFAPFLPVILTRIYEAGCRHSLYRTAGEFLFFPLPDSVRRSAKRFIDAVVSRAAEAAAALVILSVGASMGGAMWQISLLLVLLTAGWVGFDLWTQQAYRRELSSNLQSYLLKNADPRLSWREVGVMRELEEMLSNPDPLRAEYAFDLLNRLDRERLVEHVPTLIRHPAPALRARALQVVAEAQLTIDESTLRDLLQDEDIEVRMNASYAHCMTNSVDPRESIQALLRQDNLTVRVGALQCLSSHSAPEFDREVDEVIALFVENPRAEARLGAARAIGRRSQPTLTERHLFTLLFDSDIEVRRQALLAAGHLKSRESVPHLIERLATASEARAAAQGLLLYGERVVGTLADHVVDSSVPIRIRRELPGILARIGTGLAVEALVRASVQSDRTLAYRSLKALNKLRDRVGLPALPRTEITQMIAAEAAEFQRLGRAVTLVRALEPGDTRVLLLRVLGERSDQAMERLFRRLGLLYPAQDAHLAYLGVTYRNERLRTQAIEFLDSVLEMEHRRIVLPLLESADHPGPYPSAAWRPMLERSLREIADGADPWLLMALSYAAGALHLSSFRETLEEAARTGNALLREAAAAALGRLDGEGAVTGGAGGV